MTEFFTSPFFHQTNSIFVRFPEIFKFSQSRVLFASSGRSMRLLTEIIIIMSRIKYIVTPLQLAEHHFAQILMRVIYVPFLSIKEKLFRV